MADSFVDMILERLLGPPEITRAGMTPGLRQTLPAIGGMRPNYQPGQRESDMVEDRRPADVDELVRNLTTAVENGRPTLGRAFMEMNLDDAQRWQREGVPPDKSFMFRPPPMMPRQAAR